MKKASRILLLLGLALLYAAMAACGEPADDAAATMPPGVFVSTPETTAPPQPAPDVSEEIAVPEGGGILRLQVNPDILVIYDADGTVVDIRSWNADAAELLLAYTDFDGKNFRTVIGELVAVIGDAGYFDASASATDTGGPLITIELQPGSVLPGGTTMDDIADDVRAVMRDNDWVAQIDTVDLAAAADGPEAASASDTAGAASASNTVPVGTTGRRPVSGGSVGTTAVTGQPSATTPPAAQAPTPAPTRVPAAQASSTNAEPVGTDVPANGAAESASATNTSPVLTSAPAATVAPTPAPTAAPAAPPVTDLGGPDDIEDSSGTNT